MLNYNCGIQSAPAKLGPTSAEDITRWVTPAIRVIRDKPNQEGVNALAITFKNVSWSVSGSLQNFIMTYCYEKEIESVQAGEVSLKQTS